jgi:geranylgeranyl transferase type-2 subunit alpha
MPAVWHAQQLDERTGRQRRDEEFELVRQAMFVDPEDESVWTYHDWLISLDPARDVLDREIDSIRQLYELEPDSKWCTQALAHYLSMQNTQTSKEEARELLDQLGKKDPKRSRRYDDEIAMTQL